jgi:hypothetical protein
MHSCCMQYTSQVTLDKIGDARSKSKRDLVPRSAPRGFPPKPTTPRAGLSCVRGAAAAGHALMQLLLEHQAYMQLRCAVLC